MIKNFDENEFRASDARLVIFRVSYLQAFYFSLKTKDEIFHVAAVEALFALLLRC